MMAEEENSSPPSSLPPYPEMIMTAITALSDTNGSSKSAISKHIESEHLDLPAGHSTLLAHHLNKLKESGELVFAKNNYIKPESNATPKRGRGRPPKPKASPPADGSAVASLPRPRGRPPKPKDPFQVAAAKASSGMPKRRGRPPKKSTPPHAAAPEGVSGVPATTVGVKRGRGRPPKVKMAVTVGSD